MNIVFAYSHFYTGGSETLIFRLAKHYRELGNKVDIICIDMIDTMLEQFSELKIGVHNKKIDFPDDAVIDEANLIISLGDRDFIQLERYKNKKGLEYKNLLYVVHPLTLSDWSLVYHEGLWKPVLAASFRATIKEAIKNNSILFMDEQCMKETYSFFGIRSEEKNKYAPVPVEFDIIDDDYLNRKVEARNKETVILTVARADFPFKGYIIGLIDCFVQIKETHPNIRLRIVSYGKDVNRVRERIGTYKDIELIEGMDYTSLLQEYKKAHICVGMGTTLLEAANAGSIVIPIESYTYKCNSWGFLDERIDWLVTDKGKGSDATDMLVHAIECPDDEYRRQVCDTWNKAKEYYDLHTVSDIILNWPISDGVIESIPKLSRIYEIDYRFWWVMRYFKKLFLRRKAVECR